MALVNSSSTTGFQPVRATQARAGSPWYGKAFILLLPLLLAAQPATTQLSRAQRRNPPNTIDHMEIIESADGWSDATTKNIAVFADDPPRITLGFLERGYPRSGTWTSEEIETDFDFTELLPSWNLKCPAGTGAVMDARVRQSGKWSPWVYMQSWGKTTSPPKREIDFDGGNVQIDVLRLTKPADAYQIRIELQSFIFDKSVSPAIRRLAVVYSGVIEDAARRAKLAPPTTVPSNWARDIDVPFRAQGAYELPKPIWGMICSPTSTSMVMEFLGVNRTTLENAEAIYDPQYDMFGNWGRAIARASQLGLDGELQRFRNWDQVKAVIATGTPIVASIEFAKGEVQGFLYESTGGHLLVIRGMTPDGSLIVNDPAKRDKGKHVIYPAKGMATAWFDNGGVGYVLRKSKSSFAAKPTTAPAAGS
jgi:hypothetical protein